MPSRPSRTSGRSEMSAVTPYTTTDALTARSSTHVYGGHYDRQCVVTAQATRMQLRYQHIVRHARAQPWGLPTTELWVRCALG